MKKIESTLNKITEQIFTSKDFKDAKQIMLDYLETTSVKDKVKMIEDVTKINNLISLQRYCANSLLKYEGLGTLK